MKVLLINISLRPNSKNLMFPVGLAYIATAVKNAGFAFEILDLDTLRISDEEIEERIKNIDFDVVAFGCIVTGYKFVKKLASLIKKHKNALIIVGNSVADSIPEILLTKTLADIAVIGEGDITIIEALRAIENKTPLSEVKGIQFCENGKIVATPPREPIHNLDSLPFIDYSLFDMEAYLAKCKFNLSEPYPIEFDLLRSLPINTARGCPFRCSFCYHVFKTAPYRVRSMENIGKEIKYLQRKFGLNYIQFADELTLFSKEQVNNLADYFLNENINIFWVADCRADLFGENDLDLALKLKKAGCVELGYSLETADEELLRAMNKRITVNDFVVQTKILQQAGITTSTSLVIGYPGETEETLKKTFDCCYDCNIYPSSGYLLPQPGTAVYKWAIEKGIIKDEEEYLLQMGDRQDFRINLTDIPQERMENLVKEHLKRIADKLNLGLDAEHLIKTGHYRQKKDKLDNNKNMANILENKTILITGGVGSFGSKFVEIALAKYNPKSIRIFDISEEKEVAMERKFQDTRLRFLIGDVRDRYRLERAMAGCDIVVHTAALKHVTVCEYNPIEAVRVNIDGAVNVVNAAIDQGVPKVIALSTDKAVYPVNLYGASKMVMEKIFIQGNTYGANKGVKFACTRYGNVIGSSGSVAPLFKEQAKTGKITITDEKMTRFWITLEQGVEFVIKSIERMDGGEVFVPKIPSMKIMDLANLIAPNAQKEIIGIRPGEKIHEDLITKEEARHTKEYNDYFIIEPEFSFWQYNEEKGGKPLADGFKYTSDTNKQWLTEEDLKKII